MLSEDDMPPDWRRQCVCEHPIAEHTVNGKCVAAGCACANETRAPQVRLDGLWPRTGVA